MPNYKGHLFGGLITYALLFFMLSSQHPSLLTSLQWLFCCLIGSLFPDIDTKSKIQKLFYTVLLITFAILALNNKTEIMIALSFLGIIPLIVKHRGIFHKAWFILFLSTGIVFISNVYFPKNYYEILISITFFTIGAFSHLYLDLGLKRMFRI